MLVPYLEPFVSSVLQPAMSAATATDQLPMQAACRCYDALLAAVGGAMYDKVIGMSSAVSATCVLLHDATGTYVVTLWEHSICGMVLKLLAISEQVVSCAFHNTLQASMPHIPSYSMIASSCMAQHVSMSAAPSLCWVHVV